MFLLVVPKKDCLKLPINDFVGESDQSRNTVDARKSIFLVATKLIGGGNVLSLSLVPPSLFALIPSPFVHLRKGKSSSFSNSSDSLFIPLRVLFELLLQVLHLVAGLSLSPLVGSGRFIVGDSILFSGGQRRIDVGNAVLF